jgi:hypothetical protein
VFKRILSAVRSIPLPRLSLRRLREFAVDHREGLLRWGKRAATAGSLALIVLVVHRSVYNFLVGRPDYRVKQAASKVDVTPSWADPRTGEGVVHLRMSREEWSLFDETLVERIGRAFERNAWVKRVTRVERVFPDGLQVNFELRKAHLAVVKPDGIYVIDRDGVRLPGVYAEPPACESAVRFTGLASRPPAAGERWTDPEISTALEMAALAAREPLFAKAKVAAIDLANFGARLDKRRPEIALVTAAGCTIEWGRAPSSRSVGEMPLADKLDNLRRAMEAWPGLEGRLCVKLHVTPKGQLPPTVARESALGNQKAPAPRR